MDMDMVPGSVKHLEKLIEGTSFSRGLWTSDDR
jgi:hypothetical protein